MSKIASQCHILQPLQKRIILSLAHKGPQTIHETAKNVGSQYKATYIAFQSLKSKGLIKNEGVKTYRNRKYSLFWLTDEGLVLALIHGANPDIVKEHVVRLYGENEIYDFIFELAKALPRERLSELYTLYKFHEEGKPQIKAIPITNTEAEVFFKILMKYPGLKTSVRKVLKAIEKTFEEVLGGA